MKEIIVVGGGAAGLMAAITAAKQNCKVTILEHMNRVGQKLERTGNGKCNFTNENQKIEYYHSQDMEKCAAVLQQFSVEQTLTFFEGLGIFTKKRDGYCYPYSGQASAISDVLRMEAQRLKVKLACNIQIKQIEKKKVEDHYRFFIFTEGYTYEADAVILATGSMAAPETGSDGSGYELAKLLGHSVIGPFPALVQLFSKDKELAQLAGLRIAGAVTLYINEKPIGTEQGEIQFIKNGLSGIPVFQLSRYASECLNHPSGKEKKIKMELDLMPYFNEEDYLVYMNRRRIENAYKTVPGFLIGLFSDKMIKVLCARVGSKGNQTIGDIDEKQWKQLLYLVKHLDFTIYGTNTFSQAQVCAGGIPLQEVEKGTLESIYVKDLYFAGEMLDVDGICGGYNLQWAWASGYVAGMQAALKGSYI